MTFFEKYFFFYKFWHSICTLVATINGNMSSNIVKHIIRESVIKSYAEAINTMSVVPIKELIHPEFYFRLKGIDLDIKGGYTYIKHLARAFWYLVEEDKSLNAEMVYMQSGEQTFPCIKLHPPIDTKFLISLKKVYATDGGYPEHYEDAILENKKELIQGKIDYCEDKINELVYQLYGLTPEEIDIVEGRDKHALGVGNQIYLVKHIFSNGIDIDNIKFSVSQWILPNTHSLHYLDTRLPWIIIGDGKMRNPTPDEWKQLYNILKSRMPFTKIANPLIMDGTTINIDISINDVAIKESGVPLDGAQKILNWIESIDSVY